MRPAEDFDALLHDVQSRGFLPAHDGLDRDAPSRHYVPADPLPMTAGEFDDLVLDVRSRGFSLGGPLGDSSTAPR